MPLADRVGNSAKALRANRLAARWAAAIVAANAGDTARARSDFNTLWSECGNDPQCSWIADDCRRRLAALR